MWGRVQYFGCFRAALFFFSISPPSGFYVRAVSSLKVRWGAKCLSNDWVKSSAKFDSRKRGRIHGLFSRYTPTNIPMHEARSTRQTSGLYIHDKRCENLGQWQSWDHMWRSIFVCKCYITILSCCSAWWKNEIKKQKGRKDSKKAKPALTTSCVPAVDFKSEWGMCPLLLTVMTLMCWH